MNNDFQNNLVIFGIERNAFGMRETTYKTQKRYSFFVVPLFKPTNFWPGEEFGPSYKSLKIDLTYKTSPT